MKKIKKIAVFLYQELNGLPLIIKCIWKKMLYPQNTIVLKGFFIFNRWKIANFNWGDDINYYFFKEATKKEIVLLPDTKLAACIPFQNYLCIGSTIMSFDMRNTIVWGSGLLNDQMGFEVKTKPKQVRAVRGPLTRKWLLEQGIECPEIYGDPALLLPQFYKVNKEKKYRMGIIPHYIDMSNPTVERIISNLDVKVIKVSDYKDWHDFIDEINECEFIVSSSLHGIIISEAYGVPSIWAKFEGTKYVEGWDFKFYDFYESIQKKYIKPLRITEKDTVDTLEIYASTWRKGNINTDSLLEVCPFDMGENK